MTKPYAVTFSIRHANPQELTAYYRPSYFSFYVRGCCKNIETVKAVRKQIFEKIGALKSSPNEPSFFPHDTFVLRFYISSSRKDLKIIQDTAHSVLNQNGIPCIQ